MYTLVKCRHTARLPCATRLLRRTGPRRAHAPTREPDSPTSHSRSRPPSRRDPPPTPSVPTSPSLPCRNDRFIRTRATTTCVFIICARNHTLARAQEPTRILRSDARCYNIIKDVITRSRAGGWSRSLHVVVVVVVSARRSFVAGFAVHDYLGTRRLDDSTNTAVSVF